MTKKETYSASNIQHFQDIHAIRKRPTMYINNVGVLGNSHLINEAVDNAIDEHLVGHCNEIYVELDCDNKIYTVQDDGRGIPVVKDPSKYKKLNSEILDKDNVLRTIVEKSHSGGKFDKNAYSVSGGLNGVGTTCINALSDSMQVVSMRDGFSYHQEFAKGSPVSNLTITEKTKETGTIFSFSPDVEIMKTKDIDYELTMNNLEMRAYLNKGLGITVTTIKDGKEETKKFKFKDGIVSLVKKNLKTPLIKKPIYFEATDPVENVQSLQIAFSYDKDAITDNSITFANGINTVDGGTHLTGFRQRLSVLIKKYMKSNKLIPTKKNKEMELKGEDFREGLVAVVSIKLYEPEFMGQSKQKLGNEEALSALATVLNKELPLWLEENPTDARNIAKKVIASAKGREASKSARVKIINDEKHDFLNFNNFGKLHDCVASTPDEEAKLYIVEGDSAGGTLKEGKTPNQAIYPLRGKILNTYKKDPSKFINRNSKIGNLELTNLAYLLKCGIKDNCDPNKLRYKGGIYLATDADDDGSHIASLVLLFIEENMPQLIEAGYVYITLPPLYSIKLGKEKKFFTTQDEFDNFLISNAIKKFYELGYTTSLTKAQLTKLFRNIKKYQKEMDNLVHLFNNYQILELYTLYTQFMDVDTPKELQKAINSEFDADIKIDSNYTLTGFLNGEFQFIELTSDLFIKNIELITSYIELLLDNDSQPLVYDSEGNEILYPSEIINLIKSATPINNLQRYKGLGENNADTMSELLMNPLTSSYILVTMGNIEEVKATMQMLFSDSHTDERKDFISKNLDSRSVFEIIQ